MTSETLIQIPKLSLATHEGTITQWIVADGESVNEGEPLYVIQTDKTDTEVPAPASGIVHWEAELNEPYPVGTLIGYIDSAG